MAGNHPNYTTLVFANPDAWFTYQTVQNTFVLCNVVDIMVPLTRRAYQTGTQQLHCFLWRYVHCSSELFHGHSKHSSGSLGFRTLQKGCFWLGFENSPSSVSRQIQNQMFASPGQGWSSLVKPLPLRMKVAKEYCPRFCFDLALFT